MSYSSDLDNIICSRSIFNFIRLRKLIKKNHICFVRYNFLYCTNIHYTVIGLFGPRLVQEGFLTVIFQTRTHENL